MTLAAPHVFESLVLVCSLACALAVRPWRLLAPGSRHQLLPPLLAAAVAIPLLWWWPGMQFGRLSALAGASMVLLSLGWPLSILLFVGAGALGLSVGVEPGTALDLVVWRGIVPATLALAGGYLVRSALGARPIVYLLGRGFIIPGLCTVIAAAAAHALSGDFDQLGSAAAPAIVLVALGDAMITGILTVILVGTRPTWLATWSDELYLGPSPPETAAA